MKTRSIRQTALCIFLVLALIVGTPFSLAQESEHPYIKISVRDTGVIYAELMPEYAPITVTNFLKLVSEGFYDGLTFHRIISGFMVQGGDPKGNGTGGSAETIKGEFSSNGVDNPLKHERGVLSMARSSAPDSASSQFFIMHQAASHLDGSYAAFGRVVAGIAVVDILCDYTPVQDRNGTVAPADQPVIERIERVERQEAEAAVAAEQQNGRPGAQFRDPYSPAAFTMPEDWARAETGSETQRFLNMADEAKQFLMRSYDYWRMISAAARESFGERSAMNTESFGAEGLADSLNISAESMTPETIGDLLLYRFEDGGACYFTAIQQGYLYLFVLPAGWTEDTLDTLRAILGTWSFD
ncbi:MAG: peptidylprolyl isomerase [Clostridia bacterium]|nr:peptidylprolyl isomerase [Clostridia bacterium]